MQALIEKIGRSVGGVVGTLFQAGRDAVDLCLKTIIPFMAFVTFVIGLILETGYDDSVAIKLKELGHSIIRPEAPLGGAQAILINQSDNVLIGASDGRKDGIAIGF